MNLRNKFFFSSTSFHTFNADRSEGEFRLNIIQKLIWFFLNVLNNNLPPKRFENKKKINNLRIKSFAREIKEKEWDKISYFSTPSRIFCDLFWMKLNWQNIKSEVGPINIFDTGCGDGNYAIKLNDYSGGINFYLGIDAIIDENWKDLKTFKFIKLKQLKSTNFIKEIPKNTNFFMTQSAIEHFENDLDYFRQIKEYIVNSNSNIIQVHLFPTPPSLWLYFHHGVRQYNMRSVMQIIKMFNNKNSYAVLYPLGGKHSFYYHLNKVTIPEYILKRKPNIREMNTNNYFLGAKQVISNDLSKNSWNFASFCALIIHSNYKKKIF